MASQGLSGKNALVTGGSRGIGRATCIAFAEQGCSIAFSYNKNVRAARETENAVKALGVKCVSVKADASSAADCGRLVKAAVKAFQGIDFLVNNAGVEVVKPFRENSVEEIDSVIDTNLKGMLYITREALPFLSSNGVIVNVSSGLGKHASANVASYCASKFGGIGFTKSIAQELTQKCYAVCPGGVDTDMYRNDFHGSAGLKPEQIAQTIAYLCSPSCREPSGKSIEVYSFKDVSNYVRKKVFG
ncbi:MAG TPA: SDR family oxidoreductase [archaeon]|nr:SDR family oxidoreductase [archaeon]